jgi:hypothetical protein
LDIKITYITELIFTEDQIIPKNLSRKYRMRRKEICSDILGLLEEPHVLIKNSDSGHPV